VTIAVGSTATLLLGSAAAVEVGAGVATGVVETGAAGVEVVVVVVVVVAVLAGVGSEVVVETWRTSTAGSAGCDGDIVSVSSSSSEARNFAIAFRARSGNGPDRVFAQFCSMRASCASTFSTVFMSSSVSVDIVGFVYVGAVVVAAMAARRSSRLRIFFAAFRQILSIFWSAGTERKSGLIVIDISTVLVLGYGVLWCSGALVLEWVLML
jgi:hypothetical protein